MIGESIESDEEEEGFGTEDDAEDEFEEVEAEVDVIGAEDTTKLENAHHALDKMDDVLILDY
ncbi:hypothetical protein U1Q18_041650 [Sarracenia purpurea var. burkii]